VTIQLKTGLIALALLGSTALGTMTAHAADKEISWIYCGDKIDPIHEKYIKEWEGKNEGWKIAVEVVGWSSARTRQRRSPQQARRLAWLMSARAR
jgi:multiple sugar transport system substrate-binding protein